MLPFRSLEEKPPSLKPRTQTSFPRGRPSASIRGRPVSRGRASLVWREHACAGDGEYAGESGLLLAPDVALFANQPLSIETEERDPDKVLVAAVFELDTRAPLDDDTISVYHRIGKLRIC